jgi:hypothetical protein
VAAGGYSNTDPALGDVGVLSGYRFTDLGQRPNDDRAEALHMVLGFEGTLAARDYNVAYTHSQSVVRGNHRRWLRLQQPGAQRAQHGG